MRVRVPRARAGSLSPLVCVQEQTRPPHSVTRYFCEAKELNGSFDAGDTHGIVIVNSIVAFKLDRAVSDPSCAKKASLSASWALTTSVPGSTSGAQASVAFG
jgi:hypothetical protein